MPESLREIPAGAFQYDYNVKRIFIPASITIIDKTAFEGCDPSVIQYTGTQAQWKKLQLDTVFNPDFMNIEYNFASDKVDEHIWSQEREWDGEDPYDCTVARTKSYHCIVCGAIDERSTVTVPGKEHTWSAEKIYDKKMIWIFMTVQRVEPRVIIAKNAVRLIKIPQNRSCREVHILTDRGK